MRRRGISRRGAHRRAWLVGVVMACANHAFADGMFSDEAKQRGIHYIVEQGAFGGPWQYGCGIALCDLDGDGDEDLVATGNMKTTIALFENVSNGHFVDRTATAGLGGPSEPSGLAAGDYDADGDLDLCLTRWLAPAILYRNDGNLHFTDVSLAAGIITQGVAAGAGAAWADFDGDGWIDLSIANRTQVGAAVKNRLFRNQGDGTFVDVATIAGVADAMPSFQASWCDIERDGDLDLYVANDKGSPGLHWNRLYRNNGNATFTEDLTSGASIAIDAMGVCFGDLTGDLVPDIYVPNVPTGNVFLGSNQGLAFSNMTTQAGVGAFATCWGGIVFDPDHDGDSDLFVTSSSSGPDFLYEDLGSWPLVQKALEWGIGSPGESYCHAVGDIDGDGDQDLVVQAREENLRVYINHGDLVSERHWAKFRAVGRGADRNAIGLQIEVSAGGVGAWRQVECGSAYKSQSSLVLHVGLNGATTMDTIVARWPNAGGTRVLSGYPANRTWTLWPNERLGDADGDGGLSFDEWQVFRMCLGRSFTPGCELHDFDGDADVDAADEHLFLERYCDLDDDGTVDAADLAWLIGLWGTTHAGAEGGDFDGSGAVDEGDLALLVLGWSG